MKSFFGRQSEIKILSDLKRKSRASLVALMGRRRIGKSTLVDEFSIQFKNSINITGLAPRAGMTNLDQLRNFHTQLRDQTSQTIEPFFDWYSALKSLADLTKKGEWLVLLDEISWMGAYDRDFAGQLKVVWDKFFHKNSNLILVVCGSISSWIEENIINNADFVGRISLQMTLQELPLPICSQFWGVQSTRTSSLEKLKILSVTGGVPKYLEEIIAIESAEQNLLRLCFRQDGPLFSEFDKIFNEIFLKRNSAYRKITEALAKRKLSASGVSRSTGLAPNGDLTRYLQTLELSGFIKKDFAYSLSGKKLGHCQYRLKDNYLRFYLKYIQPNKEKIESGNFNFESVYQFSNWESTVCLQFENLILQNLHHLYHLLNIRESEVIAVGPYIQKKTTRTKGAAQIDIVITTKFKTIYLCELKVTSEIDSKIKAEMQKKIKVLRIPRGHSLRTVLIYEGMIREKHQYTLREAFDFMIPFEEFFRPYPTKQ